MSELLGNDFGTPEEPKPTAASHPFDGDGLRLENAELRVELEDARRELQALLVEKENVLEVNHNLQKELQRRENEARAQDQRPRRRPSSQADSDPIFASLNDWVTRWLLPLFRRELDGRATTFCMQWWRHPEAYYRLDALWKSWEFMRLKPGTGTAVWLKDYLDPHMAVLMSSSGPMAGCTLKKHSAHPVEPWPLEPIPGLRQLVRLYDVAGLQYADPRPAVDGRRALAAVEALPWDGKDQQR